MDSDGDIDDVWDKLTDDGRDDDADAAGDDDTSSVEEVAVDLGPPVRVTFVVRATGIPVAPWAQGWRVGALGPDADGNVTLICEHDIDLSPVAQLSAVTGLLGTIKQAQLDLVWWAIQSRGPFPGEHQETESLEQELADLLEQRGDADADVDR